MKVTFAETDPQKVLSSIRGAMAGRKLGEMVNINLNGTNLEVVISKLGTSTLTFTEQKQPTSLEYTLKSEKIAFAHRAFKDDVTSKIVKVIEQAGGKVT